MLTVAFPLGYGGFEYRPNLIGRQFLFEIGLGICRQIFDYDFVEFAQKFVVGFVTAI
jgi:hypothetical protein